MLKTKPIKPIPLKEYLKAIRLLDLPKEVNQQQFNQLNLYKQALDIINQNMPSLDVLRYYDFKITVEHALYEATIASDPSYILNQESIVAKDATIESAKLQEAQAQAARLAEQKLLQAVRLAESAEIPKLTTYAKAVLKELQLEQALAPELQEAQATRLKDAKLQLVQALAAELQEAQAAREKAIEDAKLQEEQALAAKLQEAQAARLKDAKLQEEQALAAKLQELQEAQAAREKAIEDAKLQEAQAAREKAIEDAKLQEAKAAREKAIEDAKLQEAKAAREKAIEDAKLQEAKAAREKAIEDAKLQEEQADVAKITSPSEYKIYVFKAKIPIDPSSIEEIIIKKKPISVKYKPVIINELRDLKSYCQDYNKLKICDKFTNNSISNLFNNLITNILINDKEDTNLDPIQIEEGKSIAVKINRTKKNLFSSYVDKNKMTLKRFCSKFIENYLSNNIMPEGFLKQFMIQVYNMFYQRIINYIFDTYKDEEKTTILKK